MNLSKYDILSCARLSFDFSFHNKEKSLDAFENYETTEDSGNVFLKTKSLNYAAAKTELARIYMLIKQHATTEWDNFVQVNISFDENISKIYQLNALKLILSTNEEIDSNLYKVVKPYICDEYLLLYNESARKTEVRKGYFEV